MRRKKASATGENLREVKNAGYTATRKVKRDKTVNRRAGLHDKAKNLEEGEVRVKKRKPLALKHVRRMRKAAAVLSVFAVGAIGVVGVGFFAPQKNTELDGDFKTVCFETPTDGTKPTDHTLVENVGYLNYTLQNAEWWSSEMHSSVSAMGFSQSVETYKKFYDGVLISADIAKGFSQKATQFCVVNDVVLWRSSASKNFDKMDTPWTTGDAQGMTVKSYKKNRGFPPSEFSVYVLNELTIKNATDYTVVDNADGTYSMTLDLNVNTGTDETCADYYYKLQMKVTGDLYDCPKISKTSVTYTFDENWRVLKFNISDTYNAPVSANLSPGCSSNTTVVFDYGKANAENSFWKDYFSSEYDRLKDTLTDDAAGEENADNALGFLAGAFASVLSDGAVFKLDLNFDKLSLGGVVCVDMRDGLALTAKLGDMLVWTANDNLYLNYADLRYKLSTAGLLSGGTETTGAAGGFDVASLMDKLTEGEFALDAETGIATLKSDLELFGIKLSLNFEFTKGEKGVSLNFVEAKIPVGDREANARLCFGDESDRPAVPDKTDGYADVMNSDITFDVNLGLFAGGIDEKTLLQNGVALDGRVALCMRGGKLKEIRADFGDLAIYYEFDSQKLYLKVGETKAMLDISAMDLGAVSSLATFADINSSLGLSKIVSDFLYNLVAETKLISSNADMTIMDAVVPVWLKLDLHGGICVEAGLTVVGIDAIARIHLGAEALEGLDDGEKEEYIDVLKDGQKIIENLLGEHISATVSGEIYSENALTHNFTATVEYATGKTEEGKSPYLHINIALDAKREEDDSLYLDLAFLDANPVVDADGKTAGGYTADGKADVYLSVSKYSDGNVYPAKFYAPVDEIMTIAAMAASIVNLGDIKIENSEVLSEGIAQIAELLDGMLISKYLPQSVQDKLASLGESLIPQILGVDLQELLNKLIGGLTGGNNGENGGKAKGESKFLLSDKYVSSITTTEDTLNFVLNSSLIYNKDIADNLSVSFIRALKDGVYFVDSVEVNNVYFGADAKNKLDLGMKLSYDEISLPDSSTAFEGYVSASGADSLLSGLVNSATHSKEDATDREKEIYGAEELPDYILNHYYYINGRLTATLNIIDLVTVPVELDLVALSVTIDEETNEVALNARLHYNSLVAEAFGAKYIAITGESDVDLTVKSGMLYIKRTQYNYLEKDTGFSWSGIIGGIIGSAGYDLDAAKSSTPKPYATPVVTYRAYSLDSLSGDMGTIMDLVSYVFNLNEKIVNIIDTEVGKSNGAAVEKTDLTGFDYGALANYYFKHFIYSDDGNGNASWQAKLSGAFLTDLTGMEIADPVITFGGQYTVGADGNKTYIIDKFDLSNVKINFVAVGSKYISIDVDGGLEYYNPQLKMKTYEEKDENGNTVIKEYEDVTSDNSLIFEEVFGCAGKDIAASPLWTKAVGIVGKDYLEIGMSDSGAAIKMGKLGFVLEGNAFGSGDKKWVLYTDTEVLSAFDMPAWTKKNGYSVSTAFDSNTVTLNASYNALTYNVKFDFGNISVFEEIEYVYGKDLDLSGYIGKTYSDSDGLTWKILSFEYGGKIYGAGNNTIIAGSDLADIYKDEVVLKVNCEEVAGDTATHVTLNSPVSFTYSGFDGAYNLLNVDFADGADYALGEAVAEGYIFLGWWYMDNGEWRKIDSVQEFAVEGKASFVTLEGLWIKASLTGSGVNNSSWKENNYVVSAAVDYGFDGNNGLTERVKLSNVSYSWQSYSWSKWSDRGHSPENFNELGYNFDKVTSTKFDTYSKWRINVSMTIELPDGSSRAIDLSTEGSF